MKLHTFKTIGFASGGQPVALGIANTVVWLLSIPAATLLRYDFSLAESTAPGVSVAIAIAIVSQLIAGVAIGTYRRKWIYGTFEELVAHASTILMVGTALQIYGVAVGPSNLPRSVPAIATFFSINVTIAARSFTRLLRQKSRQNSATSPLVIVGAGNAAGQIIRTLISDSASPFMPVAIVDDNKYKRSLRLSGVRVRGVIDDLPRIITECSASHVLLAIPSAQSDLIRRVVTIVDQTDAELLLLPRVEKMFGVATTADIRPVQPEDLLGRPQVELDANRARAFISNRRVLVTGAGGSIGSELCRQLTLLDPKSLIMLDRDETGLHSTQLLLEGHGLLNSPDLVLADIRDEQRIFEIFSNFSPEVVFHAAALKHMPLLQLHPEEAWKTNVLGTWNVLSAASSVGVTNFINISTDKAANPQSVLGRAKRLTEQLTAGFAEKSPGEWTSVRFGNVLGSRGSVLETFRTQFDMGRPLTVTHPEVSRYFMTVSEAVRLTIFAATIGGSGQVMVLDMGEPVRILDVARRFAEMTSPPLKIQFTGLRPGEKLHEVLLGDGELDNRPTHPLISQVDVPPIRLDQISIFSLDEVHHGAVYEK